MSGLAGFDLEYRIATSSSPADDAGWQPWLIATSATSSIFSQTATSGDIIYFHVRATDRAGNTAAWSEAQTTIALPPPPAPVEPQVFCAAQYSYAAWNRNRGVSGQQLISQTFTATGSPYILYTDGGKGEPIIAGDIIIEPGVVIKVGGWYQYGWSLWPTHLTVRGKIIAQGTPQNPIIFTSAYDQEYCNLPSGDNPANPHSWGGFIFESTGNIFENAFIRTSVSQAELVPIESN